VIKMASYRDKYLANLAIAAAKKAPKKTPKKETTETKKEEPKSKLE
tara:strand:+ start:807 stop:944 length:138 start_codon:yes stop_codon:yes gene_type:complete